MAAHPQPERQPPPSPLALNLERALWLIIVALVAYRLAYHATYLGEVPFAHATFTDGAVYEQAARDILEHPPLGRDAFYLQGAYAYLLALGMAIQPWPSFGLLVQLLVAFAALALFHRCAVRLWGRRAGLLSSIALLAHPGLSFYENKYLGAEFGIACNVLALACFALLLRLAQPGGSTRGLALLLAALGLGLASGLAILARPNMILALPFTLIAAAVLTKGPTQGDGLGPLARATAPLWAAIVLGTLLALAPMAGRNLAVTGHPDVQPSHGGGTSFFIGNNPKSKGVWNDGGLLSARLGTESRELAKALEIDPELSERDRARAIGEALYARSFTWIREHPGDWIELEVRKLWLTIGDQQLTQDYDWLGERELLPWAHRIGVSFSVLLALGLLGFGALRADAPNPTEGTAGRLAGTGAGRALTWFLAGQVFATLAANLLFFTSAQHRLPLVIPLALLTGPGLLALIATIRSWNATRKGQADGGSRLPVMLLVVAGLSLVQGPWPRSHREQPHPVHYYNLAMVQDSIGDPRAALESLNRAIALRPDQAIFHMRRAHLRVRLLDLDGAERDIAVIDSIAKREGVPDWVIERLKMDRRSIAQQRAMLLQSRQ